VRGWSRRLRLFRLVLALFRFGFIDGRFGARGRRSIAGIALSNQFRNIIVDGAGVSFLLGYA